MPPIRILLSIEHQLHAELLKHALASAPQVELVGEATEPLECVQLVSSKNPDFWIHSWGEGPELETVLSHIDACHPSLSVIRINPKEAAGYIQMQVRSLSDLLGFLTRTRGLVGSA